MASRRRSGDHARHAVARTILRNCPITGYRGRPHPASKARSSARDDPDDPLPRAHRARSTRPACGSTGPATSWRTATRCPRSSSTSRSATAPASSTRRRCSSTGSTARTPSAFLAGVLARDIRDLPAGPRPVHLLVRRPRLRRRGRGHPAPRTGRVPPHRRRAEPRLLRGPRSAAATSRSRTSPRTGACSPSRARARATCSPRLAPAIAKLPYFGLDRDEDRQGAGHRVADRLHRRSRLRGLGADRRRAQGLGRALGGQPRPGRRAVRDDRAVHGPHRGRAHPPRRRLPLEPVRLDRRRPVDADRARPRLDVQGHRDRRSRVHRPRRDPARARRRRRRAGS